MCFFAGGLLFAAKADTSSISGEEAPAVIRVTSSGAENTAVCVVRLHRELSHGLLATQVKEMAEIFE